MKEKFKTAKQLERHCKGIANHHRIDILMTLMQEENLTLDDLIKKLNANQKTLSEHTRRLLQAGLINKTYRGREVLHTLSPYGKIFARFLKTLQQS